MADSFPKSGTHLLIQILQQLPYMKDWANFIASMPSVPFLPVSDKRLCKKINSLFPGELSGAHLFYSKSIAEMISNKSIVHYFIYRDPRDVVISEAYYLTFMNRWHQLSKYYRRMHDMNERILFSITGSLDPDFPYEYPNIARRFILYQEWLQAPHTFSLRYEDLIGPEKEETIRKIFEFYRDRSHQKLDPREYAARALKKINPAYSHTYRKGQAGGWRTEFTEQHRDIFKKIAGDILIKLGYEKDNNW